MWILIHLAQQKEQRNMESVQDSICQSKITNKFYTNVEFEGRLGDEETCTHNRNGALNGSWDSALRVIQLRYVLSHPSSAVPESLRIVDLAVVVQAKCHTFHHLPAAPRAIFIFLCKANTFNLHQLDSILSEKKGKQCFYFLCEWEALKQQREHK